MEQEIDLESLKSMSDAELYALLVGGDETISNIRTNQGHVSAELHRRELAGVTPGDPALTQRLNGGR